MKHVTITFNFDDQATDYSWNKVTVEEVEILKNNFKDNFTKTLDKVIEGIRKQNKIVENIDDLINKTNQ